MRSVDCGAGGAIVAGNELLGIRVHKQKNSEYGEQIFFRSTTGAHKLKSARLKPSPIIRSAVETLNTFINEEAINLSYATTGGLDMANFAWATPPATMADGIAKLMPWPAKLMPRWSACQRKISSNRPSSLA